ncbi:MAG: tetratricopeptide repeat protein [Elusimicrobia bacterium]|nr:tetratricopeptide repeat protein [Elusimicrobiota bacterium]
MSARLSAPLLLLAAAMAAASSLAGLSGGASSAGLWSRAKDLSARGRDAEALPLVRALLAGTPDEPVLLLEEAKLLYATGDSAGAAASAERVLLLSAHPTEACPLLGNAYHRMGDPGRALAAHRRCAKLDPRDPVMAFHYANALEGYGRFEAASRIYAGIWASSPGLAGAGISLARVLLRQGRAAEAARLGAEVFRHHPGLAGALVVEGQALAALGKPGPARRRLEAAVRLAPAHPDVQRQLARLLWDSGERAAAAEAYARLAALAPGDAEAAERSRLP